VSISLCFSLLILLLSPQEISPVSGQITVIQEDAQVTVKQGHPFHTTCKYKTSITALHWYQLRKGQAPQLISVQSVTGPRHSGRITTHLNTTGKYSVLKVEEVQVSDSALYLCAVVASVLLPWLLLQQPRCHGHT
uniref:Ig-like domain-containing protein n=1 Tax=Catharus ustulatus TaxID=91951 RepID=A0A8C3UDY3_CATUS